MTGKKAPSKKKTNDAPEKKPVCGIVMPISAIDGCDEDHWKNVRAVLKDAIEEAGCTGDLVSESDESRIIHDSIVNHLYDDDLIICDISCRNANVMLELGMRLAFDKPVIVIKDTKTPFSFDTGLIAHLEYDRKLSVLEGKRLQSKLVEAIHATLAASKKEDYTTFLGHFKRLNITPAKIAEEDGSKEDLILQKIRDLDYRLSSLYERDKPVPFEKECIIHHFPESHILDELEMEGRGIALYIREKRHMKDYVINGGEPQYATQRLSEILDDVFEDFSYADRELDIILNFLTEA